MNEFRSLKTDCGLLLVGLTLAAGSIPVLAFAHPVAYQGATAVQFFSEQTMREGQIYYSFRPYAAGGARHLELSLPNRESKLDLGGFNFLLKRWNEVDSQANIYASAAYGSESVRAGTRSGTALFDLDLDWESRKYYTALLARTTQFSDAGPLHYYSARAGIAPYLAEYGEIQSWLILEASKTVEAGGDVEITPLVRVFYKNFLFEVGRSFSNDFKFNFMVHH